MQQIIRAKSPNPVKTVTVPSLLTALLLWLLLLLI